MPCAGWWPCGLSGPRESCPRRSSSFSDVAFALCWRRPPQCPCGFCFYLCHLLAGYSCHLGTVTHRVSGSCQSRPTALVSGCGCSFLRPQDPELFSQVPCAHGRIGTDSLSASPGWAAGSPGGHHGSTCWDRWDRAVLARLWPWLWGGGSHSSQCRQAGPTATAALGSARAWRLHLRVPPCMRLGASVTLPLVPVSSGWPAVYTSLVGPLPWTRRRLMLWPPPPELMSPNPALLPLSSFEGLLPAPGSCLSCLMF